MLTYFYNEFRPVDCMHFIKRGVNNSWLTQLCLLHACGTLGHCFILTHSINTEGDLQIYCRVVFLKTRHRAQTHVISCTLITLCSFCGCELNTKRGTVWWVILLASVVYGDSMRDTTFVAATLGHPTNLGVRWSWLFPGSSIKFLTRRGSVGIFSPTWR